MSSPAGACPPARARYRPRNARSSSLYRLFQDHLEEYLLQRSPGDSPAHPAVVEGSFRAFLECGVFRFGMMRYRCPSCDESLFVAFSCKRRGACPSCDGKRAALTATHALDSLLPDAAYRQWVLVVPKRLRWFIHRVPELAGEASRVLAREIELQHRRRLGEGAAAQIHFLQRFGSSLNLHLHVHAVVSDGVFRASPGPLGGRRLEFLPADPPSEEELAGLVESVRRKLLRRFLHLGVIGPDTVREMLAWKHSGFSVHARTVAPQGDRAALERLLYYCGRPAVSVKRLTYLKEEGLAVYETLDKALGPKRLVLEPVEFIERLARLIPPPRKNVVRYYGALGPNSPLRPLLNEAAASLSKEPPLAGLRRAAAKAAGAARASARRWARLLSRVFEVDPLICSRCGSDMEPAAAILDDKQPVRLLAHLGLPADFPKLLPARSPPTPVGEGSQVDPGEASYEGIDWIPPDEVHDAPAAYRGA